MSERIPSYDDVNHVRILLKDISIDHWIHNDLFTINWWFLLVAAIVPWFLWWKVVDKKRLKSILIYGLFIGIFASVLDIIGADNILWGYPDKLMPTVPPLLPADLTVIPVSYMLIYQYYQSWTAFVIATVIWSFFFAFCIETSFVYLNLFTLYNWTHFNSFLGFTLLSLFVKWIVEKLNTKADNALH